MTFPKWLTVTLLVVSRPTFAEAVDIPAKNLADLGQVEHVSVSRDGSRLLAFTPEVKSRNSQPSQRQALVLWDLVEDQEITRIPEPGRVAELHLSPDGALAAIATEEKKVVIVNLDTMQRRDFTAGKATVDSLFFSSSGERLIFTTKVGRTHVLTVLDLTSDESIEMELEQLPIFTLEAAPSPVEDIVAVVRVEMSLRDSSFIHLLEIYQLSPLRLKRTIKLSDPPMALAYSGDGSILAVFAQPKKLILFATSTWNPLTNVSANRPDGAETGLLLPSQIAVSYDGKWIATDPKFVYDDTKQLWEVATGQISELPARRGRMAFLPQGPLALGTQEEGVVLVDPESGNHVLPPFPKVSIVTRPDFRVWTSANGKFSVEAQLLRSEGGFVTLRNKQGREITVSLEKLSEKDRNYANRNE